MDGCGLERGECEVGLLAGGRLEGGEEVDGLDIDEGRKS